MNNKLLAILIKGVIIKVELLVKCRIGIPELLEFKEVVAHLALLDKLAADHLGVLVGHDCLKQVHI
jgi:hypothetical protein